MRLGAGEPLHRLEITPVPAHAEVQRKKAVDYVVFEVEQAIRHCLAGLLYLRSEAEHCLKTAQGVHPHTEINHYEIRIRGKIYSLAVYRYGHPLTLRFAMAISSSGIHLPTAFSSAPAILFVRLRHSLAGSSSRRDSLG